VTALSRRRFEDEGLPGALGVLEPARLRELVRPC
jgi:hypothetical protein